ncbi:hypothetical protein GQR58_025471 [Nymphon striatum]|nr:hypothetical protein GQR58_025471 [Nymphon striatum]
MENKWYNEQKQLLNIRIAEKIENGKKKSQYTQKCLQLCKGWGGLAISVEELHQILRSHPDMKGKIVRNELICYRDTDKSDVLDNPTMFKVNKNLHEERLVNLCTLLAGQESSYSSAQLPTNRDAEVALESNVAEVGTEDDMEIEIGKYYVTLITEGECNTWNIASCDNRNDDGTFQMDHLVRVKKGNNLTWKHSRIPDTLDLHSASILDCHVDGTQFWPILCSFENHKPFVVALFYGESKPSSIEDYLHDFIEEFTNIEKDEILMNNVSLKAFVCDAPARSFLKCTKGHTGYYACERCEEYADHQTGITPLSRAGFPCVSGFCLDYMHLVCLGVVRRILYNFKQGPVECKLSQQQMKEISTDLVSFSGKLPSEFARQPRSLKEMERWKATEFRQFLLYTGPIVLKKVLHKVTYQHFLTVGISILLDEDNDKRNSYLDFAKGLLDSFVENCKEVYSPSFPVYSVHGLKHLSDDYKKFNCSLNLISSFPFENHLQIIKRLVKSSTNPISQVSKRISEMESAGSSSSSTYSCLANISANKRNGCLLLKNEDFAFVREKKSNGSFVCDVIRQDRAESFFTQPCDSKLLNIVLIRNLNRAQRRLVSNEEIQRKVVCLPFQDKGYVLAPLLHGMESFVRSYSNNQMSCYKENNNEIVSILFNLESRHECESWDVTTSAQTEEEEEEESNTHHRVRKRARVLDDFYLGISQIQQALQRKQNIEKHLREKLKKSKRDLLAIESQNRCLVRENKKLKEAECVKELNKLKKAHSKMKVIKNQQKDSQIAIIKDLTKTNTTLEKRNKELEFIIDNLHTELENIQQEQTVVTTKSNKKTFSATFRKAAFHCLLHQVPVETTASLIKHIVAELANVTIDFLPNPVQLVSLLTS